MLAQFTRANDTARNEADTLQATRLQTAADRVVVAFLDFVDGFDDISPEPVPHVHQPHEDVARRCRLLAPTFLLASWAVAYDLSATEGASALATGFWTLFGVVVADGVVQIGLTAMKPSDFITSFSTLYLRIVGVSFLAGSVVFLGRIASPALADFLVDVVPPAWWVLEIGLVLLAALGFVGVRRFGYTGVLTRRHDELTGQIARHQQRIQQRVHTISGQAARVVSVLILAVLLAGGRVDAQVLSFDRSGSVANAAQVEAAVVDSLVAHASSLGHAHVVLLGAQPLSALRRTVAWQDTDGTHLVFAPLVDAGRRRASGVMKAGLLEALTAQVSPPSCTSMPAFLVRLMLEQQPVLYVTDGKDDCGHRVPAIPEGGAGLFIVLVPAKGDPDDDVTTFSARREALLRLAPQAKVGPLGLLDQIVRDWAAANDKRARRHVPR